MSYINRSRLSRRRCSVSTEDKIGLRENKGKKSIRMEHVVCLVITIVPSFLVAFCFEMLDYCLGKNGHSLSLTKVVHTFWPKGKIKHMNTFHPGSQYLQVLWAAATKTPFPSCPCFPVTAYRRTSFPQLVWHCCALQFPKSYYMHPSI